MGRVGNAFNRTKLLSRTIIYDVKLHLVEKLGCTNIRNLGILTK